MIDLIPEKVCECKGGTGKRSLPVPGRSVRLKQLRPQSSRRHWQTLLASATPASSRHAAFTLLEVVLALGLAVVVLGLVSMAVNTTLKTLERGRVDTERDQLARAVLQRIATDLRAVVRYEPFDETGLAAAGVEAASQVSDAASQAEQTSPDTAAGAEETAASSYAADATPPAIAGLYGNQYELQIDVSRLPRADEFTVAASGQTVASDVRTVTYFLSNSATGTNVTGNANAGLIRRELPRAAAQYTATSGDAAMLAEYATVLAPEVASLEFRYFDGTQWLTEWDSSANSGLPQAVEVVVALFPQQAIAVQSAPVFTDDDLYRLVISMPAADPVEATEAATEENSETGSSSTNSGNSATGGTP